MKEKIMKYFVLSQGENPVQLFFDIKSAQKAGKDTCNAYLDVFDDTGKKLETLKYVTMGFESFWTDDF